MTENHQWPPKFLVELGVKIWKNVRVTNYDGRTITTNSDLAFDTATVIWTAGVQGALVGVLMQFFSGKRVERIRVNQFSQVKGDDDFLL
jgi:NADH dehydrogenase